LEPSLRLIYLNQVRIESSRCLPRCNYEAIFDALFFVISSGDARCEDPEPKTKDPLGQGEKSQFTVRDCEEITFSVIRSGARRSRVSGAGGEASKRFCEVRKVWIYAERFSFTLPWFFQTKSLRADFSLRQSPLEMTKNSQLLSVVEEAERLSGNSS
jgi:hypothetical protein